MAYKQAEKRRWEETADAAQAAGEAGGQTEHAGKMGSNSTLQAALQSAVQGLDYSSGARRELPKELKGKLASHFGYSVDNLEFRESSDVDALGAQAYAAGNVVHFRPGQFQPDTRQGQKMIGHEVAHVLQQAKGSVEGGAGAVSLDAGHESSADRHGEEVASMKNTEADEGLREMPTASLESAPVQGWGVGGLSSVVLNWFKGKKRNNGYANRMEGGHETLTRKAAEKASAAAKSEGLGEQNTMKLDAKSQRSLKAGSRFNDVYHSGNIPFALKYTFHTDEFINQTHHGDMQFLHAMDTSGGNQDENVRKMRRWAQFGADVYQNKETNGKKLQDKNLLDYLMGQGEDDVIQEMMLSTMVSKKELARIEEEVQEQVNKENQRRYKELRMEKIRSHLKTMKDMRENGNDEEKAVAKKGLSRYADMSVADFFTGGNKKLDAGMVALGSAAHTLEDSFAGSHAIRGYNTKYKNEIGGMQVGAGQDDTIASQTTGIMINANYDTQDEDKHGAADFFRDPSGKKVKIPKGVDKDDWYISNTQGAGLARDVAAQYMYKAAKGEDVGRFLESVTQVDANARQAQDQMTGSGRQYDKTVKQQGANEATEAVNRQINSYQADMAGSIAPNILYNAKERNAINARHLNMLTGILNSTTDPKVMDAYCKHIKEIEVESKSLAQQVSPNDPGQDKTRQELENTAKWAEMLYNYYINKKLEN